MKTIFNLLCAAFSTFTFAQTTITQWNFDNTTPAVAMNPTTGNGIFSLIGGVSDNLSRGVMPAGNPSSGKSYSIKSFPGANQASGTAGLEFVVSTVGFTDVVNVSFDTRGSNTASRFQQYEYSIDGTNWLILGNNSGNLTNAFTSSPMFTLSLPGTCSDNPNFKFRIVSVFDSAASNYSPVGYANATPSTYSPGGTWRIDNVTFYSGVLGVSQEVIAGLKVFPNPVTNGNLYITTDGNNSKSVIVYDVLGKQILKTTIINQALNLASLKAGIYILRITEDGKTATRKIVIE